MSNKSNVWDNNAAAAEEALQHGDPHNALQAIRTTLATIEDRENDDWRKALKLFSRIAYSLSADEVGRAAEAADVEGKPSDWQRLGHALISFGWTDLAAGALMQAHISQPGHVPITAELTAALELEGKYRLACDVLERTAQAASPSPLLRYLRGFNAMMIGDVDIARASLAWLRGPDVVESELRLLNGGALPFMIERLADMLARYDATQSLSYGEDGNLRSRHYVLTGGLLLHNAPENGRDRYGWTLDTPQAIKEALAALAAVLDAWRLAPRAILFPPERGSEIVAAALSELSGPKARAWHGGPEPGIIVMYDPDYILAELRDAPKRHTPEQYLFARAANGCREHAVAPDFVGRVHERNTPYWGPGFDPEGGYIEPSSDDVSQLAADIRNATLSPDAAQAVADTAAFASQLREVPPQAQPAALRQAGERQRLWRAAR